MQRAIRLSTAKTLEHNAQALAAFIGGVAPGATPGAIPGGHSPCAPQMLSVFLHVHDNRRDTMLEHTQKLYNAALSVDVEASVDIVPLKARSTNGQDFSTADAMEVVLPVEEDCLFAKHDLTTENGFVDVFDYVAVGGTFDHLHSGHKMLLTTALFCTRNKLRVGITGSELLAKKAFAERLQSNEVRQEATRCFLSKIRTDVEFEVVTISEPSGGTDSIAEVGALVVSPETAPAVDAINAVRREKGLRPMVGIPIRFVEADGHARVSSTLLRQREAGRLRKDPTLAQLRHNVEEPQ